MTSDHQSSNLVLLEAREDEFVARFATHPVLAGLARLARDQVVLLLLQRRFLSLAFTPLYDVAIDAFEDPATKRCLREILREEYPSHERPTHREDLVADLCSIGASWDQVVSTASSTVTTRTVGHLFESLLKSESRPLYEVKVLSFLRLAGEVLVAKEYERIWPCLEELGLCGGHAPADTTKTRSRFYFPHLYHDKQSFRLSERNRRLSPHSHSDKLTTLLRSRLRDSGPEAVGVSVAAMERAVSIKRAFYDQFSAWLPAGSPGAGEEC